jgi:hypothetical protein
MKATTNCHNGIHLPGNFSEIIHLNAGQIVIHNLHII